ncbi:hypothetical protein STSP2_00719 [Anaerohalosphaera lusitana]|uniref:Type II secretion system protein G n=1 Tax=Anaerohalosphaera lusitana TaxID=1936003 RepID=A0A1U9NI25_9BACT|nr:hypothetical protein [Anaerohalosphaera lusitana]AQT67571.1 hypothetical protein STSP2_00719 [Anaerohalosphaera lusitana]
MRLGKNDCLMILLCCVFMFMAMGAMGRGSKRAKTLICQSNLRKLGQIATLYAQENDGKGFSLEYANMWCQRLDEYTNAVDSILLCPETVSRDYDEYGSYRYGDSRTPWMWNYNREEQRIGTYAFNGWLYIRESYYGSEEKNFKDFNEIQKPSRTPVFADGNWVDTWPDESDEITAECDLTGEATGHHENGMMVRVTMDRHYGVTNVVFADGHAEAVPLSKLWSLNWHKGWQPKYNVKREDGSPIYKANSCE